MSNDDEYDHLNRKLRNIEHCALHRRTIEVTCLRCNRVKRFDAVALWWLFEKRHWDDGLKQIPPNAFVVLAALKRAIEG